MVNTVYRGDKENANTDALARQPHQPTPAGATIIEDDVQVLSINT